MTIPWLVLLLTLVSATGDATWYQHYEQGLRGELRTEDLAYFGAMILIFLSLARAAIDSLRWR